MFREYIQNPIDPIPVEYVKKLHRLENEPDYALTCLGIAMLKSRVENYQGIGGIFNSYVSENYCVQEFLDRDDEDYPVFCYYKYDAPAEDRVEINEMLAQKGYEIKDTIGAFLKDKCDVKCMAVYHKEKNSAAIFMNSNDIRFYHMVISFLPLLFPALFVSKPLEAKDYDMIKSLSKPDKQAFVQKIQDAVKEYTTEFRRMMLSELLKAMHDIKIAHALQDVDNARNRLNEIQLKFSDMMREVKRLSVIYEGMKATESYDEPEENLVDYLSTNKQIRNLKINNERMCFSVATLLNNYNADAWSTFSERGYIYDGRYGRGGTSTTLLDAFSSKANRKILLDNLFSESPEFSIKICGNYCIDLGNCYLSADRGYNYLDADPMFKSYIPNPHLKLYGCLGGYEDRVVRALRDRNYIGAIEMCCASAGSVNLEETEQTFRPFLGWLLSSREKILQRKDGVEMTPEEALVYLKDKEKENETNCND